MENRMKRFFLALIFLSIIASIARGEPEETGSMKGTPALSDQELKSFLSTQGKDIAAKIASNHNAISPEALNTLLSSSLNRPQLADTEIQSLFTRDNVAATPSTQNDLIADAVKRAKDAYAHPPVKQGDLNVSYDVIIQMGHYKRTTGRTGTAGRRVSEQEMGAYVGTKLIEQLGQLTVDHKPIRTVLIGADDFKPNLNTKIFVALHCDSAEPKCKTGPSLGYSGTADAPGMNSLAVALALTLGLNAEEFMRDNFTKDLQGYYAFHKVNASKFKGVLEMSELTCPAEEDRLLLRADDLAANLAVALQFALR